jgi:hypothetical protein
VNIPGDHVMSDKSELESRKNTNPIICTTGGGRSSKPAKAGATSVVIPKSIKGMD